MVDYSKWDKFQADISDDEDEEIFPKVTKLGGEGGKVEIGPEGVKIVSSPAQISPQLPSPASSSMRQNIFTVNGADEGGYCWTQTRQDATLRVRVPIDAKSKDISLLLDKSNNLVVSYKADILVNDRLVYDCVRNENDFESACDWELTTFNGEKYVEIMFVKKSPIAGATIWWKKIFYGSQTEVDLTSIVGRDARNVASSSAWEEAHRLFKEKIGEKGVIDISDNDE